MLLSDYVSLHELQIDEAIADILSDEERLESLDIPVVRKPEDYVCNNYGRRFCKMSALYIFNGRVGNDRFIGSYTTSRNSVVDYAIGSPSIFSKCVNFEVRDFDSLFSNINCVLQFNLKSNDTDTCTISESDVQTNVDKPTIHNDKLGYIWDSTKKTDLFRILTLRKLKTLWIS